MFIGKIREFIDLSANLTNFLGVKAIPSPAPQCSCPIKAVRLEQQIEDVSGTGRDGRTRTENANDALVVQRLVVAGRDDAPGHDQDVWAAGLTKGFEEARNESQVTGCERADADHVDVVFDGLARHFGGRAEQRTKVDVEAEVGEGRGDDFGAPIVAVLPHLGDEDARTAAGAGCKRVAEGADVVVGFGPFHGP